MSGEAVNMEPSATGASEVGHQGGCGRSRKQRVRIMGSSMERKGAEGGGRERETERAYV